MEDKILARKITDKIFEDGFNTYRSFYDMAFNASMQMAEAKDKQYELISKVSHNNGYREAIQNAMDWFYKNCNRLNLDLQTILDFRKIMEEQQ